MRVEFGFYPMSTGHYDPTLPDITIKKWHKKAGDTVKKDEPILSLETDKLELELESPASGTIMEIYEDYKEDGSLWKSGNAEKLPDGRILYHPYLGAIETEEVEKAHAEEAPSVVDEKKEEQPASPAKRGEPDAPRIVITPAVAILAQKLGVSREDVLAFAEKEGIYRVGPKEFDRFLAWRESKQSEVQIAEESGAIRAVPAARALARENNLNLLDVKGTGDYGTITLPDVQKHISENRMTEEPSNIPDTDGGDREPLHATQMRKAIAYYMAKSHAEIPKAGDSITIDVTHLWKFYKQRREVWREDTGTDFSFTGMFMFFATRLLRDRRKDFGIINAYWDKDAKDGYIFREVNIGIAVQTPEGLMIPVLHNAGALSFRELMLQVHDKVQRAMSRKITLPELRDLTFTVNNVGAMGGENPDSIVPYTKESGGKERPTGMIMVLGAVKQSPGDSRRSMTLAFSFDHRLFDGAPALEFVNAIKSYIEKKRAPEEFRELFSDDFIMK